MNEATLVRKGMFRKVLRAILMMVSIAIAFFIFGMLGAIYNAFTAGIDVAAANRLVTVNKINFTVSMPYAYYGRVQQVEGVENVAHANWFGGYYQEPANFVQTFAVEPEGWLVAYPELVIPADQRQAFIDGRTCMAAGEMVATQYGWSVGDRIPLSSNIFQNTQGNNVWELDVCAIFTTEDEAVPTNYVLFQYEYYNESLAFARDSIGWMIINTADSSLNDQVIRDVDALFANSAAETETTTEAAFNRAFLEQLGDITLILTSVIGAAFASILIIVGTTLFLSINERTKEIAVLKTLGFNSTRIFRMILSESLLLSLIGGVIGLGLSSLIVMGLAPILSGFIPGFGVATETLVQGAILMTLFGLVTGFFPAFNAMRLRIVDAFSKL
ncbi:ABC transporter permease [Hyphobacterium sp.]|uniref:ABC transporter permease n=1 Tax=Hyphobacterium sp. TaxID=2004662 RepID=UPI003BAC7505